MPPDAAEVLNREWLSIRARLLEVASALDRIDRAEGSVAADPRIALIGDGLAVLGNGQENRAEQLQMAFSLRYDPQWRERYGV